MIYAPSFPVFYFQKDQNQISFLRCCLSTTIFIQDEVEHGDTVTAAVQITGTHTRKLVVPMPGMPLIPPTGKKIALPEEHMTFTFKGDKIASLASDNVPGGGVLGVLAQIGALPQM